MGLIVASLVGIFVFKKYMVWCIIWFWTAFDSDIMVWIFFINIHQENLGDAC